MWISKEFAAFVELAEDLKTLVYRVFRAFQTTLYIGQIGAGIMFSLVLDKIRKRIIVH